MTPQEILRIRAARKAEKEAARIRANEEAARLNAEHAARKAGLSSEDGDILRLMKLVKKAPLFEELCDTLNLSPGRARQLIDLAKTKGFQVAIAGDRVGVAPPTEGQGVIVAPDKPGKTHILAVVGDVHLGSKYHLSGPFNDFCHRAYKRGVRCFLQVGDLLDGNYHHSLYEQTHRGFEEQSDLAVQTLPHMKGAKWHFIQGNHDETLGKDVGLEVGRALELKFRDAGRDDLVYHGARAAYVRVGSETGERGINVKLWHPKKSAGYAKSYGIQNHIRDLPVGAKPDLLAVGHWHISTYLTMRGVHALAAGCFLGGGSSFSKSLGGAQDIGSWIVKYSLTEGGTIRAFAPEWVSYYENERVRDVGLT